MIFCRLSKTGRSGSTLRLMATALPTRSIKVRSGFGFSASAPPSAAVSIGLCLRPGARSGLAHLAEIGERNGLVGVRGHDLGAVGAGRLPSGVVFL